MIKNIIISFILLIALSSCDIKNPVLRSSSTTTKKQETEHSTNGHHTNRQTTQSTIKEEESHRIKDEEIHMHKEKKTNFKSKVISDTFLVNEIKKEKGVINVVDAKNALACFEDSCKKITNYRVYYKHKYPCKAKFLPIYYEMVNEDGEMETTVGYLKQNLGGDLESEQQVGEYCQQIKRFYVNDHFVLIDIAGYLTVSQISSQDMDINWGLLTSFQYMNLIFFNLNCYDSEKDQRMYFLLFKEIIFHGGLILFSYVGLKFGWRYVFAVARIADNIEAVGRRERR